MKCPFCGTTLSDNAVYCMACESNLPAPGSRVSGADLDAMVEEAKAHAQNGEYDQARDKLEKVVTVDSSRPEAWFYLGGAHYKLNQFASARDAWEKGKALAPEDNRFEKYLAKLPSEKESLGAPTPVSFGGLTDNFDDDIMGGGISLGDTDEPDFLSGLTTDDDDLGSLGIKPEKKRKSAGPGVGSKAIVKIVTTILWVGLVLGLVGIGGMFLVQILAGAGKEGVLLRTTTDSTFREAEDLMEASNWIPAAQKFEAFIASSSDTKALLDAHKKASDCYYFKVRDMNGLGEGVGDYMRMCKQHLEDMLKIDPKNGYARKRLTVVSAEGF